MLEQIEILEKARLYKKADAILRKVISEEREYAPQIETETSALDNLPAQQGYSQDSLMRLYAAYRPLAYALKQQHNIDLFGLPKHFDVLLKATKASGAKNFLTNTYFPSESLNVLQTLFRDPAATESVYKFLQNYPNVKQELDTISKQVFYAKGKNYFDWLKGIKSAEDFHKDLANIKNVLNQGKAAAVASNVYNLLPESEKASRILAQDPKVKAEMIKYLNKKSITVPNTSIEEIAKVWAKQFPNLTSAKATEAMAIRNPIQTFAQNSKKVEVMREMLENVKPGITKGKNAEEIVKIFANKFSGHFLINRTSLLEDAATLSKAATASAEGIEAASQAAKKIPGLNKILGPLGILLSLPAAYKWKQKIQSGEEWSAKEKSEFVQDLLNLLSSTSLFIPPPFGQIAASVLGGLSLTLMAGTYVAEKLGGDEKGTEQEQKILGTYDYAKDDPSQGKRQLDSGEIIQLTPEQIAAEKKRYEEQEIDELISAVDPNQFGKFVEYLKGKNLTYENMKIIDVFKNLEEWIKTLPPKKDYYGNEIGRQYDWFTNPTNENKSKRAIFEQKFLQLWKTFPKNKNTQASFNLKKYTASQKNL